MYGALNVRGSSPYAVPHNYNYGAGCITMGDITVDYGGSTGATWGANMGLFMECNNTTEIAIHDANDRLVSFMYYSGNTLYFGRNMGWGASPAVFQGTI